MKLLGILVVMVIGANGYTPPDPRITVSNENPQNGDVFTLNCTCPLPDKKGTALELLNPICSECGLYTLTSRGKGPEPERVLNGTMGEKADFRMVNDVLSIAVTVKLTCAHTVMYSCTCESTHDIFSKINDYSRKVNKELPIGAPKITVNNENPQKGDELTLTCTCPIPDDKGTQLSFQNHDCRNCAMYYIGSFGDGPEPSTINGTMGETGNIQLVNNVLSIGITVKLTCAHTVKYECDCETMDEDFDSDANVIVKKQLPIGGWVL